MMIDSAVTVTHGEDHNPGGRLAPPLRTATAPLDDTFYSPPPELVPGEHGEVIWTRPLHGAAALSAGRNELVLYRSRDVRGNAIAVSGIIALPRQKAPKGGYPVVSWAHGTVGSADCSAPSRDTTSSPAHPHNAYPHFVLNAFLEMGWAVVMTDYEGLGTPGPHPYLLGESEAHGILDIVRAARQLHPELSRRLAIVGHSQGGQAALFGAHHAPHWTPELELCAVAALAPASAIAHQVSLGLEVEMAFGGFAFTALFLTGAIAGNPTIDPKELLTENAYKIWPHVEVRPRVGLSKSDSWGGLFGNDQLKKEDSPSKAAFFRELELMHPLVRILAPIRISQAATDPRVWPDLTRTLQSELAALNGAKNVLYKEYETVSLTHDTKELGAHFGLLATDLPHLKDWLAQKLSPTS